MLSHYLRNIFYSVFVAVSLTPVFSKNPPLWNVPVADGFFLVEMSISLS